MVKQGTEIIPLDDEPCETIHHHEHQWWYIQAKGHQLWVHTTKDHKFYDGEGFPKQAQDFEVGDIIRHRTGDLEVVESGVSYRPAVKIEVKMKRIHLMWVNGFLSQT